jgi:hypothetical protein
MAKSIAKADALARGLKERLQFRGYAVSESRDANGWPKLTLNTNEASLKIVAADAVSKDVFGNDLVAFAPHRIEFASRDDAMSTLKSAQIQNEVVKCGIEKMNVKTHATVLATAEAAAGTDIVFDVQWPTKGI